MKSNPKTLGILAGMGPRSTTPFLEQVLDECQRQYNATLDEEFPKIIIYSLPTPFYLDKEIDHDLMQKTIIEGLKKLEDNGVHSIAMPCNSAHIYIDHLQQAIKTKLFNIIEQTVNQLPTNKTNVTLFATKTTFDSNLYQKEILAKGHTFVFESHWQTLLNEVISGIKKDKSNPQNLILWEELLHKVKDKTNCIVIACTDLNVVMQRSAVDTYFVDSSLALAKAVVQDYLDN
ncbi:aspartate/glutamate racemase family protein [Myroides profundi]|uniref:Aspartate racemase n=1 Tax=Myroides profundi TaxID=480520 RepID=A0AAJ5BCX4_MYRPR|nr:amino acid racemase [Myroides profundi]AJH14834.1 aspartate racemase [Myroides profundi]SEQ24290.1 aspartate racemase [Myroides profundi]